MKPDRLLSPYYVGVPDYMVDVYDWAYVNPRWVERLDHNAVVWVLLFGNSSRLINAYLDHIKPGSRMWQVAHVYGDQIEQVAQRIGSAGILDLTDITPIQVEHAQKKLAPYSWSRIFCRDAADFRGAQQYDIVGSFFLLHEVPDEKKRHIVDNMLSNMADDGKAVFVDYHRPAIWHPVRQILNVVNALLEPFAHSIWEHDISHFATRAEDYEWKKETFFGGVYQCTTAVKKK